MTIQRQYSLPNCTLVLEGLSDGTAANSSFDDIKPTLSMLMSAECYFVGHVQPLTGGRDFFESLVKAVSSYAQEFLSGVPSPDGDRTQLGLVQLHRINQNLHRLTVEEREQGNGALVQSKSSLPTQIDLTTVQLFDLVEAVDQFFADSQTLPELYLRLAPVSKRHAKATEPVAKRALPAAVGMSSLALAAIAFFFVPIPEVQRPKDPIPQPNASSNNLATPTPSGAGTPNPNSTPTPPNITPAAAPSPTTSPLSAEKLKASEATAPKIADAAEIEQLSGKLYDQINTGWKSRSGLGKDLTYRVTVAKDGAIVGYKPVSPEKADDKQTPLPELLYKPVGTRQIGEPLADFRVVFTTGGVLQVSPW